MGDSDQGSPPVSADPAGSSAQPTEAAPAPASGDSIFPKPTMEVVTAGQKPASTKTARNLKKRRP